MAERLAFQHGQYELTAHIRDPAHNPAPTGIEDRRLDIYRDLLFRNVSQLLSKNFPVLRKILSDAAWQGLMRDYFSTHRAQTPLFLEMAQEFLKYLQEEREPTADDPPFMLELAHYEWIELALSIDEAEIDLSGIDREGDLLDGWPAVSPVAWPLAYSFPVHQISPRFRPTEPGGQPTCLVACRGLDDKVRFIEINAVTARLMEMLDTGERTSGRAVLERLAAEMQHPQPETVVAGGSEILERLRRHEVVLGTI